MLTYFISIFYIISVYFPELVFSANYCEFGICDADEYCCGLNLCCHKTAEDWYFWAATILLVVVAVFAATYMFLHCRKKESDNYEFVIPKRRKKPVVSLS